MCEPFPTHEEYSENLNNTNKQLQKIDLHEVYSCCQKLFDLLDAPKYTNNQKMFLLQTSHELSNTCPKLMKFKHKHKDLWRLILTREITRHNFGHVEMLLARRSQMQYHENIKVKEMDRTVMQGIHTRREMIDVDEI